MAKDKKNEAYTKLRHFMVWMLILAVLCAGGFVLVRNFVDGKVIERAQEIEEKNKELEAQYEQRLAEQSKKEETGENIQWPQPAEQGWDIVDVSNFALTGTTSRTFSRQDLLEGGLMVVNRWHYLPSEINADMTANVGRDSAKTANPIPVTDYSVKLLPSAYNALYEMLSAAKEQGLENYLIEEGFRTAETQEASFEKEKAKYVNKYVGDALIEQARKAVNVPGTSEYQTGLSFRISRWKKNDTEFNSEKFMETAHFTFLMEHGYEYGFVFRFPVSGYPYENTVDKAWKTGESKKLRVFRYVGKAPAAVMQQFDMCLEEFVEYMAKHTHIAVYQDGVLKYEIVRVDDTGSSVDADVVARAKNVTASIDNMGGVIISMEY